MEDTKRQLTSLRRWARPPTFTPPICNLERTLRALPPLLARLARVFLPSRPKPDSSVDAAQVSDQEPEVAVARARSTAPVTAPVRPPVAPVRPTVVPAAAPSVVPAIERSGTRGPRQGRDMRVCVSTKQRKARHDMWRVVRTCTGQVTLDQGQGRSAYVSKSLHAVKDAKKKNKIGRSLRTVVPLEIYEELERRARNLDLSENVER